MKMVTAILKFQFSDFTDDEKEVLAALLAAD
jgi:hypothetical protein